MSQKYLIRIAELERLLSEQAEALRQKDQQLSLVEETEAFLRSALTPFFIRLFYSFNSWRKKLTYKLHQ
ncbi:TPA: hypothetical protein R5X49_001803 [Escherichia coli]|nr:hypothetical protein [Escherichia coli]HED6327405.1 hypothetical protein [Escherichia coli]